MSLAWNQLSLAVHELVGAGTQRQRLVLGYDLHLAQLRSKDMPKEIRADFSTLVAEIGGGGPHERGAASVIDAISDVHVHSMMDTIVDMYDVVTRYEPLLVPGDRGAPELPEGVHERRGCDFRVPQR